MQRYMTSILVIALVLVGATLIFSSGWFKQGITGNAIEQGYSCGSYSFISPTTAVASSASSSSYLPSKAIDNNNGTIWLSNKGVFSWIYFDLGAKRCVSQVRVYVYGYYVPVTMDVQVSNDAQNWKTVSTGWTVSNGNLFLGKSFAAESARYVRLYFTSGQVGSGGSGGTSTFYGSIGEVKVYAGELIPVSGSGSSGVSGSGVTVASNNAGADAGNTGSASEGSNSQTSSSTGGSSTGTSRGSQAAGTTETGAGNEGQTLYGEKSKKSTLVVIFIIIILLVALALAIAFYYKKKKQEENAAAFGQKVLR